MEVIIERTKRVTYAVGQAGGSYFPSPPPWWKHAVPALLLLRRCWATAGRRATALTAAPGIDCVQHTQQRQRCALAAMSWGVHCILHQFRDCGFGLFVRSGGRGYVLTGILLHSLTYKLVSDVDAYLGTLWAALAEAAFLLGHPLHCC